MMAQYLGASSTDRSLRQYRRTLRTSSQRRARDHPGGIVDEQGGASSSWGSSLGRMVARHVGASSTDRYLRQYRRTLRTSSQRRARDHPGGIVDEQGGASSSWGSSLARMVAQYLGASSTDRYLRQYRRTLRTSSQRRARDHAGGIVDEQGGASSSWGSSLG